MGVDCSRDRRHQDRISSEHSFSRHRVRLSPEMQQLAANVPKLKRRASAPGSDHHVSEDAVAVAPHHFYYYWFTAAAKPSS